MNASVVRPHLELIAPPVEAPASDAAATLAAQPAARAVRVVALARVASATRGYEQLLAGHPDGLHDLRVSLRRLRSLLRAYRPLVAGTLKKKTRRTLRSLARATNDAREAEVAAMWVASQADLPPRARSGVRDVARRFDAGRDAALKSVVARLEREIPDLLSRLNKQLSVDAPSPDVTAGGAPAFEQVAFGVIDRQKARLARALARVRSIADVEDAHRARIAAKRLRYLLEPLRDQADGYVPLARLIELQDALGAARDAHQMTRRLVREVGEMAARDARTRALVAIGVKHKRKRQANFATIKPGLLELARRARADERRAFAQFRKAWGKDQGAPILAQIP